jgi:hypothetical protein
VQLYSLLFLDVIQLLLLLLLLVVVVFVSYPVTVLLLSLLVGMHTISSGHIVVNNIQVC